jgi:hypothetical protein
VTVLTRYAVQSTSEASASQLRSQLVRSVPGCTGACVIMIVACDPSIDADVFAARLLTELARRAVQSASEASASLLRSQLVRCWFLPQICLPALFMFA